MRIHVSSARDRPHATKPSLQSQQSSGRWPPLLGPIRAALAIFLIATVKGFRCRLAQQLIILFPHDWPQLRLVGHAREGKET